MKKNVSRVADGSTGREGRKDGTWKMRGIYIHPYIQYIYSKRDLFSPLTGNANYCIQNERMYGSHAPRDQQDGRVRRKKGSE